MFGQKSAHFLSSLFSPLYPPACWLDSVSVDCHHCANDSKSERLVSSFYIPNGHLHIDLPEPHIQVQSQISVCHSHSLHSTTFSELMASMAFLYFLSENPLPDSSLSISSWYPIGKSIHCISTINLPGIFSFPSPSVRPLFFTFYPNSFVQQIITEIYRWPDAAFSCKLYVLGTQRWTGKHGPCPHGTFILRKQFTP